MLRPLAPAITALMMGLTAGALRAQSRTVDEGELEVRVGGQLVGREVFTIREVPGSQGRPRLRLTVTAWYPPRAGTATLQPTLDLDEDSLPRTLQIEETGERPRRYFVSFGDQRVTVRVVSSTGEAAREYPAGRRFLVADDSALALFAVLPSTRPGTVQLFQPRTGRRGTATLDPQGTEMTSVKGVRRELRHYVVVRDEGPTHLWFDAEGRLVRIGIPSRSLTAERTALPR
jgi:hypothetical protein